MTERTPIPPEGLWNAIARTPSADRVDPAQKMTDLYGAGRGGRPNTSAAAEDLGVSQRTVQRWLSQGMPERSDGAQRLNDSYRQWQNSPAGRIGAMSDRRESRLRRQGTTIQYAGKIRISNDERVWSGSVHLTGDQVAAILDAQLAGDDHAAHAALEDGFSPAFTGADIQLSPYSVSTYR